MMTIPPESAKPAAAPLTTEASAAFEWRRAMYGARLPFHGMTMLGLRCSICQHEMIWALPRGWNPDGLARLACYHCKSTRLVLQPTSAV